MVELIHSPELAELYNEIYRLQVRIGFRRILEESVKDVREDLVKKISLVREKAGYGLDVSDRDLIDAIWKYCVQQVRTNI